MKFFINTFFLTACVLLSIVSISAEEEAKKDSNSKPELKDLKISGVIIKKDEKYFLQVADKDSRYPIKGPKETISVPNTIDEKEINLEQFKDKLVIINYKGEILDGGHKIIRLISIEIKEPDKQKDKIGNAVPN